MQYTYKITGMSCDGCRSHVQEALSKVKGVSKASVDLERAQAALEMEAPIAIQVLEDALSGSPYHISPKEVPDSTPDHLHQIPEQSATKHGNVFYCPMKCEGDKTYSHPGKCPVCGMFLVEKGSKEEEWHHRHTQKSYREEHPKSHKAGAFYCPMNCEGDKTYEDSGDCPVCGIALVQEPTLSSASGTHWTCPMHPDIIRDEPGCCPICGMDLVPKTPDSSAEEKGFSQLKSKFWLAVAFTLPIFIISMSEMLPHNPLYDWMSMKTWNWVQFVLSIPVVFYATWMFFQRAYSSIIRKSPNMFTLIGIGAGVAWSFSVLGLLFPNFFPDQFKTNSGTVHVYFEAATVILTLVLLGQLLEARAHSKTNSAVKELLKLAPNQATKVENGIDTKVAINKIMKGDFLKVRPGEKVPVDGVIIKGNTHINESMITGEPVPVSKSEHDKVMSGTINGNQSFLMKAEKVGSETLLSQIIQMVNNASRSRAPIQTLADKISVYFVPTIVVISVITFIVWAVWAPVQPYVYALVNAVAVLIIACPCALGLATPMSVMVGVGKGAQYGILVKNAEAIERMHQVDTLVVDKTGTLTEGKPTVEQVSTFNVGYTEREVLQYLISLNSHSEHPLAEATVRYGKRQDLMPWEVEEFSAISGRGVTGKINGKMVYLGNQMLMNHAHIIIALNILHTAAGFQEQGKTVSYLAVEQEIVGFVVIGDKIKATSATAIKELQDKGIEVIMLTGDNQKTAQSVATELHLTGFKANMLPEDKLKEVERLQKEGKIVAMAGDGINDAPALAKSDVGIAMGTGTDVAIESAMMTLVKGDLKGIVNARNLSDEVMKNIRQNLFFALIYNTVGVPIAAGVLFPFFGILFSPMIAALAMSFSSVSVITNALRLKRRHL